MKLNINIPQQWDNLTTKQLVKVAKIITTTKPGKLQVLLLLKTLMCCKWYTFKSNAKLVVLLLNVPMSELVNHVNFIYEDNNRTKFLDNLKIKGTTYYKPMDRIVNLTADQFAAALDLNNKYLQTKDVEYLQYLVAVIYRKTNAPEFDKLNLHTEAEVFKKLSIHKLIAIHIAFSGCITIIAKRFKKAFPKPKTPNQKSSYGFGKIILEMTKGDLSKHRAVKNVNIYTFLEQFQTDIINASKTQQ